MLKVLFLIMSLHAYSLFSKTIIISDIDETIKQTQIMNPLKALERIYSEKDVPYIGVKNFISYLQKHNETKTLFLSASFKFLYSASDWLKKYDIYADKVLQRKVYEDKYSYKLFQSLKFIKENFNHGDEIILLGDNNEIDHLVYEEVLSNYPQAEIFIRDLKGLETIGTRVFNKSVHPKVTYIFSIFDILKIKFGYEYKNKFREIIKSDRRSYFPNYLSQYVVKNISFKFCQHVDKSQAECMRQKAKEVRAKIEKYFALMTSHSLI